MWECFIFITRFSISSKLDRCKIAKKHIFFVTFFLHYTFVIKNHHHLLDWIIYVILKNFWKMLWKSPDKPLWVLIPTPFLTGRSLLLGNRSLRPVSLQSQPVSTTTTIPATTSAPTQQQSRTRTLRQHWTTTPRRLQIRIQHWQRRELQGGDQEPWRIRIWSLRILRCLW